MENDLAGSGGVPRWLSGRMDAATTANTFASMFVVLVVLTVPWRYVFDHYVKKAGDPWRSPAGR